MELNSIILESKTIDINYPGYEGLTFKLAHLTRDELLALRKKATKVTKKRGSKPEEDIDNELFQDLYVKAVIVGWSGFTYKYLQSMIPIDVSQIPTDEYKDGKGIFAYTKNNAAVFMRNSVDFDTWVSDELADIENFTKTS